MNREERIKYFEEHQEELDAQVAKLVEDNKETDEIFIQAMNDANAFLKKPLITAEEWNRKWILSKVDDKNTNDDPTIEGIDLTQFLDMIRYDRLIEHRIVLYIRDGKVIETALEDGSSTEVKIGKEKYTSELLHAKELGAKIYEVHNHPHDFAAKPSKVDGWFNEDVSACAKELGAEIADLAIVTIDDYYSYKKSLEK